MDYLCNCKSETSNICNVVEAHCLQAMKIAHHCANGCFDWLIFGQQSVNPWIEAITHICRIKGCGGAGWPPPPIIFERLKLPQQIIYRRKENLSESPNHQKYWENILVSRFYEQFSRNRRNLGHFRKFEKISNS